MFAKLISAGDDRDGIAGVCNMTGGYPREGLCYEYGWYPVFGDCISGRNPILGYCHFGEIY